MPGEQQGGKGNGGNGKGKGNGGQHQANGGNGGGGPAVPPPANPPPAAVAELLKYSGLAKAAPSAVGLTQTTYRSFRRRLDLFGRQRLRRGNATAVEGAYLVLSQLQDVAWDASESIDYDDIELNEDPFKPIVEVLDKLFQHEEEVELPERCTEFFEKSNRERGEELQAYLARHQTMLRKLKKLKVDIPPILAGWHLLQRSGVPRWTHPQIKAMCNGEMEVDKVSKALTRMFGGDSKPSSKDSVLKGDINYVDNMEQEIYEDDEVYDTYFYQDYQEDYTYEENYGDEDYVDEIEYTGEVDEEVSAELDETSCQVEEAYYVNYLDSRRKMRELALARGFYPVVALDMGNNNSKGGGKGKGSGKGKGKGKQKGKGGGKSKGKSSGKGYPGTKKYVFGRRGRNGEDPTTSGSTAQHGPRYQRYRLPANGIKEVPDEVNMVWLD